MWSLVGNDATVRDLHFAHSTGRSVFREKDIPFRWLRVTVYAGNGDDVVERRATNLPADELKRVVGGRLVLRECGRNDEQERQCSCQSPHAADQTVIVPRCPTDFRSGLEQPN